MPTTEVTHRQKIGLFYSLAVEISVRERKQKERNKTLAKTCSVTTEVRGWCIASSVFALHCLLSLLLLLSGDIELNPGPRDDTHETTYNDRNYFTNLTQQVQLLLDKKFSDFTNFLHTHAEDICNKVDEKLAKLESSFDRLASDLSSLQERILEDRDDIYEMKQNQGYLYERMNQMERELEKLQKDSRQCTLRLFGVREQDYENKQKSSQIVVHLLNKFSSTRTWHESDIERCYRVGARRTHRDSPRPLTVHMHRWNDKMEILTNKDLRDLLRQQNIRISADLTVRQREEMEYYRQQGKTAYFRAGRLHVEERHQRPVTYNGNRQKDQHTYHHVTGEEPNTRRQRDGYGFPEESALLRSKHREEERYSSLRGERRNWRQTEAHRRRDTSLRSHSCQTSRSLSPETPGPHAAALSITPGSCEVLTDAPTTSERTVEEPDPSVSPTWKNTEETASDQKPSLSPREAELVSPPLHEAVYEELSTQPCPAVLDPAGPEPGVSSAPKKREDSEKDVTSDDEHALQGKKDITPVTTTTISSLPPSSQGLLFNPGRVTPQNAKQQTWDSPDQQQQRSESSPPELNIRCNQSNVAEIVSEDTPHQAAPDRRTRRTQARLPSNWTTAHWRNKNQTSKPSVSKKKK